MAICKICKSSTPRAFLNINANDTVLQNSA